MNLENPLRKITGIVGSLFLISCLLATPSLAGDKNKPLSGGINGEAGSDISQPEVVQQGVCGDLNDDLLIDILDVDFFIDFYFNFGPAPVAAESGDTNCDGTTDIADIISLASFLNGAVTDLCCGGPPGNEPEGWDPKDRPSHRVGD